MRVHKLSRIHYTKLQYEKPVVAQSQPGSFPHSRSGGGDFEFKAIGGGTQRIYRGWYRLVGGCSTLKFQLWRTGYCVKTGRT